MSRQLNDPINAPAPPSGRFVAIAAGWDQSLGLIPPEPNELLSELIETIADLDIRNGIDNWLAEKLETALRLLDDDNKKNDVAVIKNLEAFVIVVEKQSGKNISEDDADKLLDKAQLIIDLLIS